MAELILYFENMHPPIRLAVFLSTALIFWTLEKPLALRSFKRGHWSNVKENLILWVIAIVVNLGLAFILFNSSQWASQNTFGLYHWWGAPLWLKAIAMFVLLDLFSTYIPHRLDHAVPFLWRFHLVHHSDTELGISSTLRQHPGQSLFHIMWTAIGIALLGAPVGFVLLFQTIHAIVGQAHHANTRLFPLWLDKIISMVFLTPDIHKVHHHYELPLTDKNYGGIFSIWDRIFGTFVRVDPQNIHYGVDTYMNEKRSYSAWSLLKYPFSKKANLSSGQLMPQKDC